MNRSILYIAVALIAGLGIGYLIFGVSEEPEAVVNHNHTEQSSTQVWTCTMHPQIKRDEPGDCPICGMELIKADFNSSGLSVNQFKMTNNALALAGIETTVIGIGGNSSNASLTLSGELTINKDETATQPAHFNGRVEQLFVKSVGQEVYKGQKIATVYSAELVAAQQELITASRMKKSQPKLYDAVRAKFKNWMIQTSILDQVENTGNVITQFPVYSHVSGVVTEISINEGSHITMGEPIFKVSNLSSVWAEFDAYENQIQELKTGQKLRIKTNAYPDRNFEGVITFIDPLLNTDSRTVSVRAVLKNTEDIFKPGMFVSAEVDATSANFENRLQIPATAVLWTGERSLVYVKPNPAEPVFEMREVTLGPKSGANYNILNGLSNGEEIVTNGTFTVDAAAQLLGKKSMMNNDQNGLNGENIGLQMKLPENFQNQLKKIIPYYLKLKDAFIASETDVVSKTAQNLNSEFSKLPWNELDNIAKSHFSRIKKMLTAIETSNSLENQREHFVAFNEDMVALVNATSALEHLLYLQRCPMANNSKGAVWLSDSKKIENPYYSDTMVNCGSVINTLGNE